MIDLIDKIPLKTILMRFQLHSRIFLTVVSLLIVIFSIQAQSVKELEIQRKQTLQRLETTSKMLKETKSSKRSSLTKLTIINKNINERKALIKNISSEIGQLDVQIFQLDNEKTKLESKLEILKHDYAKLVEEAHLNQSFYTKVMFVLSAKTFDQSFRRLRYLEEYTDYRKSQVQEIEKVKVEITHKNDSLMVHKTTKEKVVQQKETESKKLSKDEKNEKVLLTDLQKKEKKLRADLKIQQKKASDINNKIEKIIAEEIRKADAKRLADKKRVASERASSERMASEAKAKTSSSTKSNNKSLSKNATKSEIKAPTNVTSSSVSALTKEESLLTGNFERNQGRLPWPTANGFISGHFGIQQHPILTHVTTNNKGIYIQTPSGSNARAVFDGVVTQRFSIPGSNNAVIIQHGNYRTVYANLTQIFVREGEKVSAKQSIGKIYTDDDSGNKTELYFQIWKDKNLQNPERWIAR